MTVLIPAQALLRTRFLVPFVLALTGVLLPVSAQAQLFGPAYVVGADHGGLVRQRAKEVQRLRMTGRRVEIRGNVCMSSCTMYLGAGDVCVLPSTKFGFHGPSYNGRPMPTDRFEYWTRLMAAHYPPQLSGWFMNVARYKLEGYYTITGAELIRMGVPSCRRI